MVRVKFSVATGNGENYRLTSDWQQQTTTTNNLMMNFLKKLLAQPNAQSLELSSA
jgi:hypothetical protein